MQLTNVTMYTGIVTKHKVCRRPQLLKVYQFTETNCSGVKSLRRVYLGCAVKWSHTLTQAVPWPGIMQQQLSCIAGFPTGIWINLFSQLAGDSIEELPVEELPLMSKPEVEKCAEAQVLYHQLPLSDRRCLSAAEGSLWFLHATTAL